MNQGWRWWVCGLALLASLACHAQEPAADRQPERENFELAGQRAFVLAPREAGQTPTGKPWVWYAPTLGDRLPGKAESWMFDRLRAQGIAIAGIDVGESYGSPAGRAIYQKLYEAMTESRGYSKTPVLLARSRGGLMLYNWAAEHAGGVAGIAGIYPVCNLESYPGLKRAAPAYEMTAEQLKAKLGEHNPIDRLAPLAKAKVPIFHIQGDSDRVVPHEKNTAIVAERYAAMGGQMTVQLIEGGGHDMKRYWFKSQALTDFMIARALHKPQAKEQGGKPAGP